MIGVTVNSRPRSAPPSSGASRTEMHKMINAVFKSDGERNYPYQHDDDIMATTLSEINYIGNHPLPAWVSEWLCGAITTSYEVIKQEPQFVVLRVTYRDHTVVLKCCKYNIITGPIQGSERCLTHEAFIGLMLEELSTKHSIYNIAPRVLGYGSVGGSPILQRYGITHAMVLATEWLDGYIEMAEWLRVCHDDRAVSQVLTSICRHLYCYYRQWRLTHYDLHYRNIMIYPQTHEFKLIDWESSYIQLTADDVAPELVGNHGIAHPQQGYHDRGYWVHDVFKLLANCLYAFSTIVKQINNTDPLTTMRTIKLARHWQIPIPKIVVELPYGARSDFTTDDYYLQYLAEVSQAAQNVQSVIDGMKRHEEYYVTSCGVVAMMIVKLMHAVGDDSITTVNVISWMDSVRRTNPYYGCAYHPVMASVSVMNSFIWH